MPRATFISFEGIDGSGKTTQAQILLKSMERQGIPAILVREPGSTPFGDHLRQFLKGQQPISPLAELLSFEAARAELVQKVITPALDNSITVISDRYIDSSVAYQGAGRNLNLETINLLNSLATQNKTPDLTFLLHIEPKDAAKRTNDLHSRFESQDAGFYHRVARGYTVQAARNTQRIIVLDASLPEATLSNQIWEHVAASCRP